MSPASASPEEPRHRRTNGGRSRIRGQLRRRQPVLAALLGMVGFGLLLGYSVIGTGGAAAGATGVTSGTQHITVKTASLTDHDCDDSEWHFIINQIDKAADAPASITVTWANGDVEVVPLDKFTGGAAHYTTTLNLDSTVVTATADIYEGWSGQFVLSHGPCGTTSSSPPVESSSAPVESSTPPTESSTPPTESSTPPTESSSAPVESSTPPTESSTPPTESSSAPVESSTPPVESSSAPVESSSAPVESSSAPVESSSAPVESSSGPVESSSAPAQGTTSEAVSSSSAAAAATSPFVPGPGQTGDAAASSGSMLKQTLLITGLASLLSALAMSLQVLRRRGEHS
jgi:hypothetical protein